MVVSSPAAPGELRTPEDRALEALGDPAMRRILLALGNDEHDVHDLVLKTRLPQSSVYRKLKDLEEGRLVRVARFAFTPDGKKVEVYRSRLKELKVVLANGDLRVSLALTEDGGDRIGRMWDQVRGGSG